jgi:homoserine kinase
MNEIKNILPRYNRKSSGFDVLGLCLETAGDEMIIRKSAEREESITCGCRLAARNRKNVAGVSALAMLKL